MKIENKTKHTALFFTILYWLLAFLLVFRKKLIFKEITLGNIALMIGAYLLLMLLSPFLVPVFELVTKITKRIGVLIFGIITTLVYYLILTPIALFKKITGQQLLKIKYDKDADSYFEDWEPSSNMEKQY